MRVIITIVEINTNNHSTLSCVESRHWVFVNEICRYFYIIIQMLALHKKDSMMEASSMERKTEYFHKV